MARPFIDCRFTFAYFSLRMKISHLLEYSAFLTIAFSVQLLPLRLVRTIGGWLGETVFNLVGYRREITLENLRNAFPEKSSAELIEIATMTFRSMGVTFFEIVWTPNLTREKLLEEVHFENAAGVREIQAKGKGIVLLTGHVGNWEWFAHSVGVSTGIPLHVIAKGQANPFVDRFINRLRTKFGNKVVPMALSVRETLRALNGGELVGIVGDQSAARESVWVDFFGRKVPTHQGPAVFSLKTGAPIIIGFSVRQPGGNYISDYRVVPMDGLNGYTQENVKELTQRHVQIMEEIIRRHPSQWMWTHRRWKHTEEDSVLETISQS